MSRTAVIVALLIALALAVGAYLSLGPRAAGGSSTGAKPTPPVAIDASRIASLKVARPGGPGAMTEEVLRAPQPGQWVLRLSGPAGTRDWPLNASNVRGALRMLSTLELAPVSAPPAAPTENATTLTVTLDDGSTRTFALSEGEIGGRILVTARGPSGEQTGWIDAQTARALVLDGPRFWRDASPLGPELADASRITIRTPTALLTLGKTLGRWSVRAPVAAPADPETIVALARRLASVQITDYLDMGTVISAQGGGLNDPAAIITLERDVRPAEPGQPSTTASTTLAVGGASDLGGKHLYASITRDSAERFVVVTAEELAQVSTDPAAYISRLAVQTPPADVGSVFVRAGAAPATDATPDAAEYPRRFHRRINAWTRAGADGGDVPASSEDGAALESLLKMLAKDKCPVVMLEAPKGYKAVAAVQAGTLDGTPIETVEIGTADAAADAKQPGPLVVTRIGTVYRVCAPEADALLPWLSAEGL